MKSNSFFLLLLLLSCTCNFAEALWGSGKSDQQQAKDLGQKAAEDARLSAKYARDAAADTVEAAKAQGRALTGGARQKVHDYYDSAGNLLDNLKGYVGTVYDRAGNALGDAKDFAYDTASEYYDKAGNLIDNIRDYAGTVYDRAGNALGDAKDFTYGKAQDYYDSAGNAINNMKGYVGTVYDRAGNALGDAKDFAYDRAHDYYDSAGNSVSNLRDYVGTVYDRAGNALGDAKDFAYEKASNAGNMAGDKLHRAGDYFQTGGDRPCRRLVSDSCACVKSFFGSFFTLLLTLVALLLASYFIYTRLLGKRISMKGVRRQSQELGGTLKAKAGVAREKINDLGHRAKETIDSKMGRLNGRVQGEETEETTHEYNLRTNRAPVVHYSDDQWTANGHTESTGEMMEGEDGVLLENK